MIEIYYDKIVIHNYELGDCPQLESFLSVWDQITHSYTWSAGFYETESKDLTVPRGMNIGYLRKLFDGKKKFTYNNRLVPTAKSIFSMKVPPRNQLQKEAIDFLLQPTNEKMLVLKPGIGKTYCAVNFLSKRKERAIIIVDQDKVLTQWKQRITEYTNINEEDIYIISGVSTIDKIVKGKKDLPYKLYIASVKSLSSYLTKNSPLDLNIFFRKLKTGIRIYDESHVEMKNIVLLNSVSNFNETIYLTATPGRSNPSEDKIYQNIFKYVDRFGDDIEVESHINSVFIKYNSEPSYEQIKNTSSRRGFDMNAFYDYSFSEDKSIHIMEEIKSILKMTLKSKNKTALLVHKLDHVQLLYDILKELYPDVSIGRFCGLVPSKVREKELDNQLIISTDKSLGKAVDVKDLQFLISTVPLSSEIVLEQMSGRLRPIEGKNVIYFDITDIGFPACKKQYSKRLSFMKSISKSIKLINNF